MGVYSSDGKPHHSISRMKMHEEKMGSSKPPAKTHVSEPKSKSLKDPGKGMGEEQGIEQVVKEHGPAHGMHHSIQEDGQHHVVTHHADGHVHHSSHGSFGEAHDHMGKAGAESAEQEPTESPDDAEAPQYASAGGGGIPVLNG